MLELYYSENEDEQIEFVNPLAAANGHGNGFGDDDDGAVADFEFPVEQEQQFEEIRKSSSASSASAPRPVVENKPVKGVTFTIIEPSEASEDDADDEDEDEGIMNMRSGRGTRVYNKNTSKKVNFESNVKKETTYDHTPAIQASHVPGGLGNRISVRNKSIFKKDSRSYSVESETASSVRFNEDVKVMSLPNEEGEDALLTRKGDWGSAPDTDELWDGGENEFWERELTTDEMNKRLLIRALRNTLIFNLGFSFNGMVTNFKKRKIPKNQQGNKYDPFKRDVPNFLSDREEEDFLRGELLELLSECTRQLNEADANRDRMVFEKMYKETFPSYNPNASANLSYEELKSLGLRLMENVIDEIMESDDVRKAIGLPPLKETNENGDPVAQSPEQVLLKAHKAALRIYPAGIMSFSSQESLGSSLYNANNNSSRSILNESSSERQEEPQTQQQQQLPVEEPVSETLTLFEIFLRETEQAFFDALQQTLNPTPAVAEQGNESETKIKEEEQVQQEEEPIENIEPPSIEKDDSEQTQNIAAEDSASTQSEQAEQSQSNVEKSEPVPEVTILSSSSSSSSSRRSSTVPVEPVKRLSVTVLEGKRRQSIEQSRRQSIEQSRRHSIEQARRQSIEPPRRQSIEPSRRQSVEQSRKASIVSGRGSITSQTLSPTSQRRASTASVMADQEARRPSWVNKNLDVDGLAKLRAEHEESTEVVQEQQPSPRRRASSAARKVQSDNPLFVDVIIAAIATFIKSLIKTLFKVDNSTEETKEPVSDAYRPLAIMLPLLLIALFQAVVTMVQR